MDGWVDEQIDDGLLLDIILEHENLPAGLPLPGVRRLQQRQFKTDDDNNNSAIDVGDVDDVDDVVDDDDDEGQNNDHGQEHRLRVPLEEVCLINLAPLLRDIP